MNHLKRKLIQNAEDRDPHHGLLHDLEMMVRAGSRRRQVLRWLSAGGAASTMPLLFAGAGPASAATQAAGCRVIPSETAGPFPGDGSNRIGGSIANALALAGIVRRDIRSSIGGAGTVAPGVPLAIKLKLVNTQSSCTALAGRAIYVWHCDRDGGYSMYSHGVTSENYLRGVQVTDSQGEVTFTTIFPACYPGRWPHIHFEIYPSLAAVTASPAGRPLRTSQLALPKTVCDQVYATAGYRASQTSLARISLASDNVFADDGAADQMAAVTGDAATGFTAQLTVGLAV